ncbi:DNA polymerase epsilon subunit C [Cajanus cajan]|uniref:DNA polymerase epsilon subunit C n=1 Tax=Cajanus cajan TaxID=3821 RepID=UPI0010FAE1CC|nr:DNA polymerase epsilon subunit C [Cajanus cajan]
MAPICSPTKIQTSYPHASSLIPVSDTTEGPVSACVRFCTVISMSPSNTPKSEKKKTKTESKTKKKDRAVEKEENDKKKNKKLKLSNGNSEQHGEKGLKCNGEEAKTNVFPMNRIRTMIKGEDPDMRVSQEALLAINNAVEKFLEQFTQDAYASCVQDRKKSLHYKHLAHVVSKQRRYDFLSDFVPEKVKAEDALREREVHQTMEDVRKSKAI